MPPTREQPSVQDEIARPVHELAAADGLLEVLRAQSRDTAMVTHAIAVITAELRALLVELIPGEDQVAGGEAGGRARS